jgi:mono/diheme cytochrome c family protein
MTRFSRGAFVVVVVLVVVAVVSGRWFVGPGPMKFAKGTTVALPEYHGANPTGVPPRFGGENLVRRGEYLARAADCMACHTATGGKEYAGGLAFQLPFGTLYSTNITPDKETGIGGYSDAEFLAAVRQGKRRDGAHLYPAMPFTSYTYMTDDDALAIKAYLVSLPPIRQAAPPDTLTFPFNQRWAMSIWSFTFGANERFRPNTEMSQEWNRGAYLAEALAHCGDCHTPRNIAFALDNRQKFAGAKTAGWRAYNVTSDEASGIGKWTDEELVSYLSTGHAIGRGTASGPMAEVVDRSLRFLAPSDTKALAAYLRSVPGVSSSDPPTTRVSAAPASHKEGNANDARGKRVFEAACVSCHGWTGFNDVIPLATFLGARSVNDREATNVAQVVISGTKRYARDGAVAMPAFGGSYSDAEIAAVANYVTARFGSRRSQITGNDVAALRGQTAQ